MGRPRRKFRKLRTTRLNKRGNQKTPEERFFEKVDTETSTLGCHLWTAALGDDGYGVFSWNGKLQRAHRAVLMLKGIDIPEGMVVDHLCGVRHCCNPDHLEVITQQENVIRGKEAAKRGRYIISEEDDRETGLDQ